MYKHFFKRALDIVISGVVLLLIGWLLILIAIFLHFANKGAGEVFLPERPGKVEKNMNGKIDRVLLYKMYKKEN